jgi:hypothetical protein
MQSASALSVLSLYGEMFLRVEQRSLTFSPLTRLPSSWYESKPAGIGSDLS